MIQTLVVAVVWDILHEIIPSVSVNSSDTIINNDSHMDAIIDVCMQLNSLVHRLINNVAVYC